MRESEREERKHSADGDSERARSVSGASVADPENAKPEGVQPADAYAHTPAESSAATNGTGSDESRSIAASGAEEESVDAGSIAEQADTGDEAPAQAESGQAGSGDLAAAQAESDAYFQDLQRVTAEFANFRRQTIKRNAEIVAQAASDLAGLLLPVLDACEAAVSQGVEGVNVVYDQLLRVLKGAGLSVVGEAGEAFDPNLHEAVAFELSDSSGSDTPSEEGPVVAIVLRTGYAWKAKVLRPAMVKVKG